MHGVIPLSVGMILVPVMQIYDTDRLLNVSNHSTVFAFSGYAISPCMQTCRYRYLLLHPDLFVSQMKVGDGVRFGRHPPFDSNLQVVIS